MRRSNLLERYFEEVSLSLENWSEDFLLSERKKFVDILSQAKASITKEQIADDLWSARNARRVVDCLGLLLEIVWMAGFALKHSGDNPAIANLLVVACDELNVLATKFISSNQNRFVEK
jgi:hypothetical protein